MTERYHTDNSFKGNCRIVSMKHEYPGYTGEAQWIIVSTLTETQIMEQYADEVKPFCPFIHMTPELFAPIVESHSNNRKHEIRAAKYGDAYSYEDDLFESFHPELVEDPFAEPDWTALYKAMNHITEVQYSRIQKRYFLKMNLVEIAKEEGTTKQAVEKSIRSALETMKKYLKQG